MEQTGGVGYVLWAIGIAIIGVAIAVVILRRRRLTGAEKRRRDEATRDGYRERGGE